MSGQRVLQKAFAGIGTRPNPYRLRLNILNPVANPPGAGGVSKLDADGIWNAVFDSSTNTIRVSNT